MTPDTDRIVTPPAGRHTGETHPATARLQRLLFISWSMLLAAIIVLVPVAVLLYSRSRPRVVEVFGDEVIERAMARQTVRGAVWLDANPRVGYRTLPSDARFGTNRDGFRSRDWREPKGPDERRVLLLGDSVTYGMQVDRDRIFSERLDVLLQEFAPGWRAYNASAPGWNVRQEAELLLTNLHAIQPDAVIHQVLRNDVYHARAPVYNTWGRGYTLDPPRPGLPYYTAGVPVSAWERYGALGRRLPLPRELYCTLPEYAPLRRDMLAPLRETADVLAALHIPYIVWHYRGHDAAMAAELRLFLKEQNVRAWYFDNPFTDALEDDDHPNPAAHQAIAEELLLALAAVPATGIAVDASRFPDRAPALEQAPDAITTNADGWRTAAERVTRGCGNRIDLEAAENYDQIVAGMWRLGGMFPRSEWVLRREKETALVVEYEIPDAMAPLLPFVVTLTVSDFTHDVTLTQTVDAAGPGIWRVPLDGLADDALLRCRADASRWAANPAFKHVESWRLRRAYLTSTS